MKDYDLATAEEVQHTSARLMPSTKTLITLGLLAIFATFL
jgi:hypothetical protein